MLMRLDAKNIDGNITRKYWLNRPKLSNFEQRSLSNGISTQVGFYIFLILGKNFGEDRSTLFQSNQLGLSE